MFTEYKFDGQTYQFNTQASLKMGKEAFLKQYKGKVPNAEIIWSMIEGQSGEKPPQNKVEKPEKKK